MKSKGKLIISSMIIVLLLIVLGVEKYNQHQEREIDIYNLSNTMMFVVEGIEADIAEQERVLEAENFEEALARYNVVGTEYLNVSNVATYMFKSIENFDQTYSEVNIDLQVINQSFLQAQTQEEALDIHERLLEAFEEVKDAREYVEENNDFEDGA
ncbi:hypothetical protein [Jeotgalibacillus aurantiacus]|uniref:hypothetical protein n=1 Tax=Jeotgalibacillus aurantiacus TaxID=2763266 RepID=UPI001D0AD4DD|nr:hypothetical protein [Jeotgalibacillus aurantiacus]